jgi:hypothetical protein
MVGDLVRGLIERKLICRAHGGSAGPHIVPKSFICTGAARERSRGPGLVRTGESGGWRPCVEGDIIDDPGVAAGMPFGRFPATVRFQWIRMTP